ncbi:hypothetical protein [Sphingomonas sp. IBVSS2]|uniref:hypothetical protein n=1 Tax=Sphingomonas sp. IBVSS2 TaxID=1985172 RepID=UPI0011819D9D|nr:hypothetical protein [Sphingomonas sp. IBVSS2]
MEDTPETAGDKKEKPAPAPSSPPDSSPLPPPQQPLRPKFVPDDPGYSDFEWKSEGITNL